MLDIETVGKGSKAAIVSIGAVFFNPLTNEVGAEFHQVINISSAAYYGEMDASTVQWWMKQSDEARAIFNDESAISLKDALGEFSEWISQIEEFKSRVVWGNGATFDNVILGNAFKAARMRQPWPFYGDRDVRTMVDLGRRLREIDPKKDLEFKGTVHNAVDDARHQARYVSAIYQALKTEHELLMSRENPTGHKLEELMVKLQNEVNAKNKKIINDSSDLSLAVQENNLEIIKRLNEIRNLQLSSFELMAKKAPDNGPSGKARIG